MDASDDEMTCEETTCTPTRAKFDHGIQTTPFRKSVVELMEQLAELFDSYGGPGQDAPLSALPDLIQAFEQRRAIELLTTDEKHQLAAFAASAPDQRVGVDDFIAMLQAMAAGASSISGLSQTSRTIADSISPPALEVPQASLFTTTMLLTEDDEDILPSDGSPAPRKRPTSALSRSRIPVSSGASGVSSSLEALPVGTPSKLVKRRSLLSVLAASPTSAKHAIQDLTQLVAARGGTYLNLTLDGPLGAELDADREAHKLAVAIKGVGTREKEVIAVLADKTHPQIRAIDGAYQRKFGRTLLEMLDGEKALKGNIGLAFKGLVMGPLHHDVHLLNRALDGPARNDAVLMDLLIGRTPSDLALLRAAYRSRPLDAGDKASPLDSAVMSSFNTNVKLRKVWELVLACRWDDVGDGNEGDQPGAQQGRETLLKEDVDQLKVALRKGGDTDVVVKTLLSRSPTHLHSIIHRFRKVSPMSLSQAIKQHFAGLTRDMLLFAVETVKHDAQDIGVWRDAKRLQTSMSTSKTRGEALAWSLVRLHWDRARFTRVQAAYQQKFGEPLLDRVVKDTSGSLRDLLRSVIASSSKPLPVATEDDFARLEALSLVGSPSLSSPRAESRHVKDVSTASEPDPVSLLEAEGEMSNPPSPFSPSQKPHDRMTKAFDDDTPRLPSEPFGSVADVSLIDSNDSMDSSHASLAADTSRVSEDSSLSSTSMSFRQQSAPLESINHRPRSSVGGSLDQSTSSLRHNRPIAPGRRRQSQEPNKTGPDPAFGADAAPENISQSARSSTPNDDSFSGHRRRHSGPPLGDAQPRRASFGSTSSSRPSSRQTTVPDESASSPFGAGPRSPGSSLDTTSYHAPPISPVREEYYGSLKPFDLAIGGSSPFSASIRSSSYSLDTPDSTSMRRQGSTASARSFNSSNSSLFLGEGTFGFDSPGARAESVLFGGGDRYQSLLRHAGELARKLKDAESRLESSSNFLEQEYSELENRLEEARDELQVKRREEKELRGTERQHLAQIASLESDISKLEKKLEKSRESYEAMKRNYTSQCDETEKLRALVAEIRRENRAAEEAAQAHGQQIQQYEQDRDALHDAVKKLEAELAIAHRAENSLDDQKQENLMLKETIGRLRFDLEEMRSAANNVAGTGLESLGTVSKSLGRELARRLVQDPEPDAAVDTAGIEGDEGEGDEDIVITTHRRIKKKKATATMENSNEGFLSTTETVIMADIETQTIPSCTQDTHVQTDLSAVRRELVSAPLGSSALPPTESPDPRRIELAARSDIDSDSLERPAELQKGSKMVPSGVGEMQFRRAGRWTSRMGRRAALQGPALFINAFPESAKPVVSQVLESSLSFVLYTATVYLLGFVSGSWIFPTTHHHHFAPFQVGFVSTGSNFNSLSGWSEGVGIGTFASTGFQREGVKALMESLVWNGVSAVRRAPL